MHSEPLPSEAPRGGHTRGDRWVRTGNLIGWAVVPTIVLMEFVDLRRGLSGAPALVSAYLVGFALLTLVCLPWSLPRLRQLAPVSRVVAGSLTVLMLLALATAFRGDPPVVQKIRVTRAVMVVPVLTSLLTMTAAASLVLVVEPALRRARLWAAGWTVLACSLLAWPRGVQVHRSIRLSTGMGGSAIYHVVLLLACAFFLGCVLDGHRRRASLAGAALSAACLLGTGSRAGLATAFVFAVLLGVWALGRGLGRWVMVATAAVGVALLAMVLLVPSMRRLLSLSDARRAENMHTALAVWNQDLSSRIFGIGSGHLWPWYALDIHMIPAPGANLVKTAFGRTLTSPHSVYLAVLAELGLVGMAVLLVALGALARQVLREWRPASGEATRVVVCMALLASAVAFVFDTYLLKNFGVSWWWWLVLFAIPGRRPGLDAHATASD